MDYRTMKYYRAAGTYHEKSMLQKEMAGELATLLPGGLDPVRILELGCGTGHLSRILRNKYSSANITLTDICPPMLDQCQALTPIGGFGGAVEWKQADAREPLPFRNVSLACSNALIQWMPDPATHFQIVGQCLSTGGHYLFSSFRDNHFPELQQLLKAPPFNLRDFPGQSRDTLFQALERAGFSVIAFRQPDKKKYYSSFDNFLKLLKLTGAGGRPDLSITRKGLQSLSEKYARFNKLGEGVLATWKPCYVLSQKVK
jgi:malonyl-CoA O-methyltransferase